MLVRVCVNVCVSVCVSMCVCVFVCVCDPAGVNGPSRHQRDPRKRAGSGRAARQLQRQHVPPACLLKSPSALINNSMQKERKKREREKDKELAGSKISALSLSDRLAMR